MEKKPGLSLTSRVGEQIFINGEEIIIRLVSIKGDQAQLKISADKDKYHILREKVKNKIENNDNL